MFVLDFFQHCFLSLSHLNKRLFVMPTSKGKKHRCTACGSLFYDLGDPSQEAKCNGVKPAAKSKTSSRSQKPSDAPEITTGVEFLNVASVGDNSALGISRNNIDISFPTIREGWHAAVESQIKDGILGHPNCVLYLADFPQKGFSQFLASGKFKGIGHITAQKMVEQHGPDLLSALVSDKALTNRPFSFSKKDAGALREGWQKDSDQNLAILLAELGLMTFNQERLSSSSVLTSLQT